MQLEDSFVSLARASCEPSIVMCDRGAMDVRSYMPSHEWEQMMQELGLNTLELRDTRYDCVVHMVTAADGAEEFYTIEGHASRSEPADVARQIDSRIKSNWIGHPHLTVVDNSRPFAEKIQSVLASIYQFLGISDVGIIKRKFLVKLDAVEQFRKSIADLDPDTAAARMSTFVTELTSSSLGCFPESLRVAEFEVDHDYVLRSDGAQVRVRRRGQNGWCGGKFFVRVSSLAPSSRPIFVLDDHPSAFAAWSASRAASIAHPPTVRRSPVATRSHSLPDSKAKVWLFARESIL